MERLGQAVIELHEKRGPMYRRWQRNTLAAIAADLLDELHANP